MLRIELPATGLGSFGAARRPTGLPSAQRRATPGHDNNRVADRHSASLRTASPLRVTRAGLTVAEACRPAEVKLMAAPAARCVARLVCSRAAQALLTRAPAGQHCASEGSQRPYSYFFGWKT